MAKHVMKSLKSTTCCFANLSLVGPGRGIISQIAKMDAIKKALRKGLLHRLEDDFGSYMATSFAHDISCS